MGKRVDLNAQQNSNNNHRNSHSNSYRPSQSQAIPPSQEINGNGMGDKEKEMTKTVAKKALQTKVPKAVAESETMDKVLDKAIEKMQVFVKVKRVMMILSILSPLIAIVLLGTFVVIFSGDDDGQAYGTTIGGYYDIRCKDVTVIFTNKYDGYKVTGTNTYPLEEYVAGVVAGEVAYLGSIEVDKELALAARSYFLTHDDNCTIESSDRRQVFRELTDSPTDQMARQAAEETKGQVLLKDGQIYGTEYDAFCSIAIDENYYTIKQANQKIPRSWVDNEHRIADSWKQGNCAGNHGNGLSQFGSLYLANEKGYTYDQLIAYYLGKDVTISSSGGFMTSIPGLEIKDTTNSVELHEALSTYLPTKGSSVNELNTFIKTNVKNNGAGTREGVVTAAVSLVNYLYDGTGTRIPYYWGGQYQVVGINPFFGAYTSPSSSDSNTYYYNGFDCSGFVSWAIRNGGYSISRYTTEGFHDAFSSDSCDITDSSCIGQPGDLINSKSCHVQMIVSVDEASGKYYVAESAGGYGVIIHAWNMHTSNCGSTQSRILHMDKFYNNSANVDTNY